MAHNIKDVAETITPDRARQLLEMNTKNRKINDNNLAGLVREIKAGRFVTNGDAIRISKSGTVLDGQHRLRACIIADTPIKALVITGLDDDTQYSMDAGVRRTLNTQLQIYGVKNATTVASMVNVLSGRDTQHKSIETLVTHNATVPVTEGVQYFKDNPWVIDYVKKCDRLAGHQNLLNTSLIGLLWREFSAAASEEDADVFFDLLKTGVGLTDGSAIFTLRNALIIDKTKLPQNRFTKKQRAALVIKAWNKYISGEECKVLRWQAGGAKPEPFPEIKSIN